MECALLRECRVQRLPHPTNGRILLGLAAVVDGLEIRLSECFFSQDSCPSLMIIVQVPDVMRQGRPFWRIGPFNRLMAVILCQIRQYLRRKEIVSGSEFSYVARVTLTA
jgi:hypothetical protein